MEHDADYFLADVVDIALDGRHDNLASRDSAPSLSLLDERQQVSDSLLHDARGLDHLWQKHLAGTKQVTDHVHAIHQRSFDDIQWPFRFESGCFGVFHNIFVVTLDQGMA